MGKVGLSTQGQECLGVLWGIRKEVGVAALFAHGQRHTQALT